MNHDPQNPECPNRDLFILSKGHAALGYYCCLAELGYFDPRLVESFGGAGTIFGCHLIESSNRGLKYHADPLVTELE